MQSKLLIIAILLLVIHTASGQVGRRSLVGIYESQFTKEHIDSFDSVPKEVDSLQIVTLKAIEINEFQLHTLFVKRFKRVEIVDNSPIPDIGLNDDNPTLYGKFKIIGDSLNIRLNYSIQHFNVPFLNKRIKVKFSETYKFKIINENQLMIDSSYSWVKIAEGKKNKHL